MAMDAMPRRTKVELQQRHEAFCQNYLLEPNAGRAARLAGYSPRTARQAGCRLLARGDIVRRLGQLRAELARQHCLDADSLMSKLEAVYRKAMEGRNYAAANRAVDLQARIAGLYPAAGEDGGG
jgi:phage terminase small subunit